MSKPFLSWVGGKTRLIPNIQPYLQHQKRLIEPFAGAAALSLAVEFDEYWLNDMNNDLIHLYQYLKQEKQDFITYAESFFIPENNSKERYYELREEFNHESYSQKRAALFLYLNKHGFNGLCRYNSKGIYNVPFGAKQKTFFPKIEMESFIQKSSRIKITQGSFHQVFSSELEKTDIIYCDPPYLPLNEKEVFTKYHQDNFLFAQHQELLDCILKNQNQVAQILLSNHDSPFIQEMYRPHASLHSLPIRRNIASDKNARGWVSEILAIF